jgi:hypothetical protein
MGPHWTVAHLVALVDGGADARQVAATVVLTLERGRTTLAPIVGALSIAALYQRSLHLAMRSHPWLGGVFKGGHHAIDCPALSAMLAQQTSPVAAEGGGALLQTFYEVLTTLIGKDLTDRLLDSIWKNTLSGSPAQDT